MRRRLVTLLIFAALVACVFLSPRSTSSTAVEPVVPQQGQKARRQQQPRRRASSPRAARSATNYSKFLHGSRAHAQKSCAACHSEVPTTNWRKARDFPDVADYPDHDACLQCHRHREQFFRGARPAICAVCHTRVSPRDDARFSFPKPNAASQFRTEFPHDRHQDIIARSDDAPESFADVRFARASLVAPAHAQDSSSSTRAAQFNNCAICHKTNESVPRTARGWPDTFVPTAGTFKTIPANHASCFNCHWKSQEPTKDDCAGCHKPTADGGDAASLPFARISLKFTHAREQHVAECTACHINITKASTSRGLKPDVPLTSCSECHNNQGLRMDVAGELKKLDENREFVCAYCHTSDVGRRDAPASHYRLVEREPVSRKDIK